ncbi:MAG: cysteine--tRNA ligase [Spirochaetales bacterium]|nr:cysteine--tRNA ligase [Spirochaetales bacterium]
MKIQLYNTLSRKLETFTPISGNEVKIYSCGPTVYNYAHIGNLRTFIFVDILRRIMDYSGYEVSHVMNITDVGHLSGDDDSGEDKMLKSSRESGKTVWDIAQYYTEAFFRDTDSLNIIRPHTACRATEHIQEMIDLIRKLEEKGHTYTAGGNVYFSIDTFPEYGKMAGLKLDDLQSGARIKIDSSKKNPKDFVLWFTNSKFENQVMIWDSPWGKGYPGWHIECSAMSMKYFGSHFDIHCGGTDLINIHHTNEIAQSEAATGNKWVNYWLHGEFLIDESGKMSKSKGDSLTLSYLVERGYDPLDYRYFCLGAHYRSQLQFSFNALDAAKNARLNLKERIRLIKEKCDKQPSLSEGSISDSGKNYLNVFNEHIGKDLNISRGLADLWQIVKDMLLSDQEKLFLLTKMDSVFGLSLLNTEKEDFGDITQEIELLINERVDARTEQNFSRADEIRDILQKMGIEIKDTPAGTTWRKKV